MAESAARLDEEEVELVRLLAEGLTTDRIARRLRISERTVRRRTRALCDRVGVTTAVQVVVWAARKGML
jgi:DNA-binding NarL/FixJ family response regulator